MISISASILCGRVDIDLDRESGKIITIETEKECVIPDIIKTLINEYGINEIKDVLQTLYCKECESNLHYKSCGRVLVKELSKLTFK